MNIVIRKLLLVPAFALVGSYMIPTAFAQIKTDFALKNTTDASVQCGATQFSTSGEISTNFTVYITMTNFGTAGWVHVTYQDGDSVLYNIAANETLQISLAGGHKPGTDQIITVTQAGGASLAGQESIIGTGIKPNPTLPGQTGKDFCTTTP